MNEPNEPLYTVVGPKSWSMMTSHELAEQLKETNVALVPCGAIEIHGGHLPLGQDNYQIEEITRRTVVKLKAQGHTAIFGPTIPFAPISNLRFPGSIDLKPSTLIILIKEICMNLLRDGITKVVLMKGHDMSLASMMVAARELTAETEDKLQVIVVNWLPMIVKLLPETFPNMPKGMRDGHGGAGETARMLAQHPNLVVPEKYCDYEVEAHVSEIPFAGPIVSGGGVYAPKKTSNHDPKFQGYLGFPRLGTVELGEKLYEQIAQWCADVISEYYFSGGTKSYNY